MEGEREVKVGQTSSPLLPRTAQLPRPASAPLLRLCCETSRSVAPRASWQWGFTLVDLIVTLMLIVTLAGLASFYYQGVREDQREAVASNELDSYAKALAAYEATTSTPIDDELIGRYTTRGFPPLQFLAEEGVFDIIQPDPWGRNYEVDPARGIVYSRGESFDDPGDDLIRRYRKGMALADSQILVPVGSTLKSDVEAPVIDSVSPVGTVRLCNPVLRATFFDNVGGAIDVNSITCLVDGVSLREAAGTESRSANQYLYTTPGCFSDGEHTAVLVLQDAADPPNVARKQWTFTIETELPSIDVRAEMDARIVCESVKIEAILYNGGNPIDRWTLLLDGRELISDTNTSPDKDTHIELYTLDTTQESSGTHLLTLIMRRRTGQVVEDRTEISVDNEPPDVRIIDMGPLVELDPGAARHRLTTNIMNFRCQATDNDRVDDVRFWVYPIDPDTSAITAGSALPGLRNTTGFPLDWNPDFDSSHDPRDPGALFDGPSEPFRTVPSNSVASFKFTTLPQGTYLLTLQAKDLCGNTYPDGDMDSPGALPSDFAAEGRSLWSTEFTVDVVDGGISGERFVKDPLGPEGAPQEGTDPPVYIHGISFTGIEETPAETSGRVQFSPAEAGNTPRSTWVVIIDDNGASGPTSGDGAFVTTGLQADWSDTGSFEGYSPGDAPKLTALYGPDDLESRQRRGSVTSPAPILEGEYRYEITYTSDSGRKEGPVTGTFFVDNTAPDGRDPSVFAVAQGGSTTPLLEDSTLLALSNGTSSGDLFFGGTVSDRPSFGAVREVRWSLQRTNPIEKRELRIVNQLVFPDLVGNPSSPKATTTVSYGSLGTVDSQNSMKATTTVSGGLDGEWILTLSITDGAGLTTRPARHFFINTIPPEVKRVRFANAVGASLDNPEVVLPPGNQTTTLDGQFARFDVLVEDELNVERLEYWFVPVTNPPSERGLPETVFVTGLPTNRFNTPFITRQTDNLGSFFLSRPTTYELQVQAFNLGRADPGPLFTTRVDFKFLTDLAIFAPFHAGSRNVSAGIGPTLASTGVTWISSEEQRDIADYLARKLPAASARVFDYKTTENVLDLSDTGTLEGFLSGNASDGTTDVLVILDSGPFDELDPDAGTRPLKTFLDSPDGEVVIWIGPEPFLRNIDGNGVVRTLDSTEAAQINVFGADLGIRLTGSAQGEQAPQPAAGPFLPSLFPYHPFNTFNFTGLVGTASDVFLAAGGAAGAGDWELHRTYCTDGKHSNGFVYRNRKSKALFACFYGIGNATKNTLRKPIPPLPFVVEEFITNVLVTGEDPRSAAPRILFNSDSPALPADPARVQGGFGPDVIEWPSPSGGFTNLTTSSSAGAAARVAGIGQPDGRTLMLSKDRSADGAGSGAQPATSLFVRSGGTTRLLAAATAANAPIEEASFSRNGSNFAVVTKSNLVGGANSVTPARAVYFGLEGTTPTPITSSGGTASDSSNVRVASRGQFCVFQSANVYDREQGSVPPNFAGLRALDRGGVGIFRFDSVQSGGAVYDDGWVSRTLGESARCSGPTVSADGTVVVFSAAGARYAGGSPLPGGQIFLARLDTARGDPWRVGAITQTAVGESGHPDATDTAPPGLPFPLVVFESSADLEGQAPHTGAVLDPPDASGASATATLPQTALFLFQGDFALPLLKIAEGDDGPCLNPRISPDGTRVVFESAASTVTGLMSIPDPRDPATAIRHSIANPGQANRVYSVRIRQDLSRPGDLPPSAIVQRITPAGVSVIAEGRATPRIGP